MGQGKASYNIPKIKKSTCETDIKLALLFLQIWADTAGYLPSHDTIHLWSTFRQIFPNKRTF